MNLRAEKIELAKLLLSIEDPEILQSVRKLFLKEKLIDFRDELTLDRQSEIRGATLQIEEGITTDYEGFMARHR